MINSFKILSKSNYKYEKFTFPFHCVEISELGNKNLINVEVFSTKRILLKDTLMTTIDYISEIKVENCNIKEIFYEYIRKRLKCSNTFCRLLLSLKLNILSSKTHQVASDFFKNKKLKFCSENCFSESYYTTEVLEEINYFYGLKLKDIKTTKMIKDHHLFTYATKYFKKDPDRTCYFFLSVLKDLCIHDILFFINHIIDVNFLEYHVRIFYLSSIAFYFKDALSKPRISSYYTLKSILTIRDGVNFEFRDHLKHEYFDKIFTTENNKNWFAEFKNIKKILNRDEEKIFNFLLDKKEIISKENNKDKNIAINIRFYSEDEIIDENDFENQIYVPQRKNEIIFVEFLSLEIKSEYKFVLNYISGINSDTNEVEIVYIFKQIEIGINKFVFSCISSFISKKAQVFHKNVVYNIEIDEYKLVKVTPRNLLVIKEKNNFIDINYEENIFIVFEKLLYDEAIIKKEILDFKSSKQDFNIKIYGDSNLFNMVENERELIFTKKCISKEKGSLKFSYKVSKNIKKLVSYDYCVTK